MRSALSSCRLYSWMRLTWQSKIVSGSTVCPDVVLSHWANCDFASRWLQSEGRSFYGIASAGHESNAVVALALRPSDPALLHYRSGAFYLARAAQAGDALTPGDVVRTGRDGRAPRAQGLHRRDTVLDDPADRPLPHQPGQAEIDELHLLLGGDHDVAGADIAVNPVLAVKETDRLAELDHQRQAISYPRRIPGE